MFVALLASTVVSLTGDLTPCHYAQTATALPRVLPSGRRVELVQSILTARAGQLTLDIRAVAGERDGRALPREARELVGTVAPTVGGVRVDRAEVRVCRRSGALGVAAVVARYPFVRTPQGAWRPA